MAKKKEFTLDIAYENGTGKGIGLISEIDTALEKELGYSESSGSGFGMRDHQYIFDDKKEAAAAAKKVEVIFKKHGIRLKKGSGGAVDARSYVTVS
jgi:hypothetical protein